MKVKRSSMLTKIVLVVLLLYALVTLFIIGGRKADAEARLEEDKRTEAALAADIDDMEYALNHPSDPAVIEDMARDEGLIYPGEEVYSNGRAN